jgi:hypothetical protein
MTDTKNHTPTAPGSLEGRVFRPASRAELVQAIELAFDYRGDVTVALTTGESVVGYLFNRETAEPDPWIEVFPADNPSAMRISYTAIVSLAFTGEDTANGKSWETWVSKKESERQAEAARVEADARTRGHL